MVEGDSGPTNVELRIELDQVTSTVTVAVSATGGDAAAGVDFGAIASPVTITAGNIAATATIPITGDLLDELNETIVITLSSPSAGTSIGSTSTVTVTILDDDDPPDLAAGATASGSEDAGTIGVPLTLLASGLPISVRYTTTVGTAGSGDFTGVSNGFHLIAAGSTNSSIPISITNDSTYEGDETFAVEIGNATTTGATTAVTTTPTSTTVTIENDELPVASADSYGVNEDSTTTVAAPGLLSNDEGQGIAGVTRTVNLVTDVGTGTLALLTDGSFVYTTSPDFPFESTSATTTFVYNFLDGRFTSTNATATITVTNVPDAPVAVDDFYAVLPGQSSSVTTSLGVLSNDFDVDGDTLTASMASTTANGTTTLASDGSFTYDPGLFVGTESFIYTVSDGSLTATGTVILSQGPTWLMSVDKNEVDEDESTITVTITLINASSTRASIVDLITVDGTATAPSDYGALSQQITLGGAFGTSTPVLITIANDPVREGDETFVVKLLNARPGSDTIAASVISGEVSGAFSISLTIDDPQDAPTVAVADATVSEGDVAQVVVTVTGKTFLTTTVIYRTMQTSSANALLAAVEASALDYQGISSGALTFGPNTTTPSAAQSIVVTTTEDTIDELDEIFAVDICGCSDSQRDGSSGVAPLTTTRDVAIVTITDDDDAPSLAIANQKARESAGTATITVTLEGGSSGGVTTTVITTASTTAVTTASATVTTTVVSSAEAGKDYQATTAVLTWAPNETGTKTFTVNVIDDAIEEDLESVILLITGTTTATSTLGVTVSDGIAKLRITNDELAAKVVGITSDSEAMPGDWFFLVVASSTGSSVNVSSTGGLVSGTLMDIDSIDDIVRGMHGLNTVRTKRSTHAWLYMVPTSSQMLGTVNFEFGTGGTFNLTSTADAAISLKIVGSRGNRNFFLSPGINFTGLGLVPVTSSVADLLKQKVASDVYPAFAEAVAVANNDNFTRGVWLQDVIETIFVFKFDAAGGWNSFHTADPLSGVSGTDPATGLMTNIKPFQGMIIKTRQKAGDKGQTVFAMVSHGNLGTVGVPIKMNVVGPFIDVTTNAPLAPPEQQLRFGWNLVAPHTQEAAPFNVVFNDVLVPERLASRAISFIREVQAGDFGSSIVGAVVEEFAIATWNEIIRPEFAYWVRINQPSAGTATPITPTIGPAGADGGT